MKEADTEAVFQRDDGGALYLRQAMDIGAEAAGVEAVEITLQNVTAVVEVVVPQGDKLITGEVHKLCGNKRSAGGTALLQPVSEGAALQDIASVDDEAVPVPHEICGAVGKTGRGRS